MARASTPMLLVVLLAAAAAVASADAASLSAAQCSLSLAPSELDKLGAALADHPKRYLDLGRGGHVDGVKTDALTKDGFSAAAVQCVVDTYGNAPNDGTGGTAPSTPSAGPGISAADRKRVLDFFGRGNKDAAWRDQVAARFGKKSTKGLTNRSMRSSLVDTFDPNTMNTVLEWLTAALGDQLPPWLQLLAPAMALIMQLMMGLNGGA